MASLTLQGSSVAVDLSNPDVVTFASSIASTATKWSWLTTAGHRVDVFGTGFTYSNGRAISGTAQQIVMDFGNDSPDLLEFLATGLNVAAAPLDDNANSFWRILDGSDTITGPRLANQAIYGGTTLIGDGIIAVNGAIGGNDIIDGGDVAAKIYGDVLNVGRLGLGGPAITYTGGNDDLSNQFTISGSSFFGDVHIVFLHCKLFGGDDQIVIRTTNLAVQAYGDAYEAIGDPTQKTEIVGGDDVIDASSLFVASNAGATLVGDVRLLDVGCLLTGGDDTLLGSNWNDELWGDAYDSDGAVTGGADEIHGNFGDDRIIGDVGFMAGTLNAGNDLLFGGDGKDTIWGDYQLINGSSTGGNDKIYGEAGSDLLIGGSGDDIIDGGTEVDRMEGGIGNDHFFVDHASDVVVEVAAQGTADRVFASVDYTLAANQNIELFSTTNSAGLGKINLTGNNLANTILGNNAINIINGGAGIDRMTGLNGADLYYVDNILDVVVEVAGGGSFDRVLASVNYALAEGQQIELLSTTNTAGTAAISLVGNSISNYILGNNGSNVINGGLGNDYLTGAEGADKFRFSTAIAGGTNIDSIADFAHGVDDVQLFSGIFTNIGGALDAAELRLGTAATTAAHRIIFDGSTGNLFFDADGNGATAQVQFAKVTAGTVIDITDFIMI